MNAVQKVMALSAFYFVRGGLRVERWKTDHRPASTFAHGEAAKIVTELDEAVTTPRIDTTPSSPSSAGPILKGSPAAHRRAAALESMLLVANP